jgi:hypothetical protein
MFPCSITVFEAWRILIIQDPSNYFYRYLHPQVNIAIGRDGFLLTSQIASGRIHRAFVYTYSGIKISGVL